jgi:hypothetical protein
MGDYDSKTKHSGGLIEEIDDTAKEEVEQKYRRCTSCGHRSTHNASNCPYDGSPKPVKKAKSKSAISEMSSETVASETSIVGLDLDE